MSKVLSSDSRHPGHRRQLRGHERAPLGRQSFAHPSALHSAFLGKPCSPAFLVSSLGSSEGWPLVGLSQPPVP